MRQDGAAEFISASYRTIEHRMCLSSYLFAQKFNTGMNPIENMDFLSTRRSVTGSYSNSTAIFIEDVRIRPVYTLSFALFTTTYELCYQKRRWDFVHSFWISTNVSEISERSHFYEDP